MKRQSFLYRIILFFCALGLAVTPASAARAEEGGDGTPCVEERSLALAECSVVYPVIAGMKDEALQAELNDRILEDCGIPDYLARMSMLLSGGSLQVKWRGGLIGDVFSCAVSAEGAAQTMRNTYIWTRSNLDLRDGHEITAEELFTDPEGAREAVEEYLEETLAPELSAHLLNSSLTPAPDSFYLTRRGLILLYPVDRLSTLSDRAGDIMIGWNVLKDFLDLGEDSILSRIGVGEQVGLKEESREALLAMTASGEIPDIPVRLGGSLQAITDEFHLLIDPDIYEDGRMFSPEGGCFRSVFLLTDRIGEKWEKSTVQGIRVDSGCIWGLCIGETSAEEWRSILGEPDSTVGFDAEKAEAYRTVPGSRDFYEGEKNRLQLHCDENGTLVSVIISQ